MSYRKGAKDAESAESYMSSPMVGGEADSTSSQGGGYDRVEAMMKGGAADCWSKLGMLKSSPAQDARPRIGAVKSVKTPRMTVTYHPPADQGGFRNDSAQDRDLPPGGGSPGPSSGGGHSVERMMKVHTTEMDRVKAKPRNIARGLTPNSVMSTTSKGALTTSHTGGGTYTHSWDPGMR